MAEQSARVAQRCEEAKATCELRLDSCDLRKFPDAVFFLMKGVDLQTVTLAHNSLTKIPAKLGAKFSTITSEECSLDTNCTFTVPFTNFTTGEISP